MCIYHRRSWLDILPASFSLPISSTWLNLICHCKDAISFLDAYARCFEELELGLGVGGDIDGYAMKKYNAPDIFDDEGTPSLQPQVYGVSMVRLTHSHSVLPLFRSCVPPTLTLDEHLAETWMTVLPPTLQNAA